MQAGDVLAALRIRKELEKNRQFHLKTARVLRENAKFNSTVAREIRKAIVTRTPAEQVSFDARMAKKAVAELNAKIALLPIDAAQYAQPIGPELLAAVQITLNKTSKNNTKNGKTGAKAAVLPALATAKPGRKTVADIKNSFTANPATFGK